MRNMMIAMGAAVLSATVLMFATPAAAAPSKPCWAHYDAYLAVYEPVWANGGGHGDAHGDVFLSTTETRLDCETAFAEWPGPV